MNRRDLLRSLASVPLLGWLGREKAEGSVPHIIGVTETPWMIPCEVTVNGTAGHRVFRCCPSEGWADAYTGRTVGLEAEVQRLYGEVQVEPPKAV